MLTEYQKGKRDIQEWLDVTHENANRKELIRWKIKNCVDNYPSNPQYQPYYDAMLEELNKLLVPITYQCPLCHKGTQGYWTDTDFENHILLCDDCWQRCNQSQTAIVQSRVHQDNITGHVLDQGEWEHLNLPMEEQSS